MPKTGRFTSEDARKRFDRAYDALAESWPVPSTQLDVATSFGTTRVRRSGAGTGAPIVLLPGIGGNGQIWHRFIAELARDRVVYTPDVIGWAGRCVQTAPVGDAADVATWMAEVIEGLGEERVHLAGNSLGAWLAGAVAVYRSDRLASLTMFEPSAATFAKPRLGMLLKFLVMGMRPTPERLRAFNKWLMPRHEVEPLELEIALSTAKFRPGMPWDRQFDDEQLRAITAPALILFGAETVVGDPEVAAARARTLMPSVVTEIVPGVGHDLLWANPEQIIPRFLDFIGGHDRVSP